MSTYFCCDELRRDEVRRPTSGLNGIDFLEVHGGPAVPLAERQRRLFVHFLKPLTAAISDSNLRIEGGDRIQNVRVIGVTGGLVPAAPIPPGSQASAGSEIMTVEVDRPGDYSLYTLRLVTASDDLSPPSDFDPLLSAVDFSFKAECPSDFDCKPVRVCPPEAPQRPLIDYLAKDYESLRRLMLDRLATTAPGWQERNVADVGITLVELLAYVGDYLSYRQDAVATEAYLGTARRRVSVRRHSRLVDYFMHDGASARVFVQVLLSDDDGPSVELQKGTQFLTDVPSLPSLIAPDSLELRKALSAGALVFEAAHTATLHPGLELIPFYTWGDEDCCLPRGATRAALKNVDGRLDSLAAGQILVFEEVRDPETGKQSDADPFRRHAVRLTEVRFTEDPLFREGTPALPVQVAEIAWSAEDALPFPLCVSEVEDPDTGARHPTSVALGNIVLADHGATVVSPEPLGVVPRPHLRRLRDNGDDPCERAPAQWIPPRFRPTLERRDITQAVPYDADAPLSATALLQVQPEKAVPAVELRGVSNKADDDVWLVEHQGRQWVISYDPIVGDSLGRRELDVNDAALPGALDGRTVTSRPVETWTPRHDLLDDGPDTTAFALEVEADGQAAVRFGDDVYGKRPAAESEFVALYRWGTGTSGNIGADSLGHVVTDDPAIAGVRNPLPARGGADRESIERVRQRAPVLFKTNQRAVTAEDYAAWASSHPEVQRAVATFRWTGSWLTVFVAVDRLGGLPVDEEFAREMIRHLEPYRMAGHDLDVETPRYLSLEVEMEVCVKPDYFRADIAAELGQVFSNRVLPDGRRGVFHPDNFTFGQPVYLSSLYAAAQAVEGVESVRVTMFRVQGQPDTEAKDTGKLVLERLQIARLDNDPNYPDRGVFRLTTKGGK